MARKQKTIEQMLAGEKILEKNICDEMKMSYLMYSVATIISRALPDVRDGLKPVQRRILYSMFEQKIFPDKTTKKSARIIGDVIGKYHPHGDQSAYGAMTNLINDFNIRYPLIKGQGNFGSADGDGAAAMRYTEAKLYNLAMEMLKDIENDAVDMKPNFSEDEMEPDVLPGLAPNLLINGASGIATGYTTDIPSHNLKEVCNAIIALLKNPDITIEQLVKKYIKGPDLSSYGYLINDENILKLYTTGTATLKFKGKIDTEISEETKNKLIVINQLPPEIKKPKLLEKLYSLYVEDKSKKVIDLRDESEENKTRIVLELHKTAIPELIINDIYENTSLAKTKNYILRAIVDQAPLLLNLKQIIEYYISHRREVIERVTQFKLKSLQKKINILEGFKIVLPHIKKVANLIIDSDSPDDARLKLIAQYKLNDEQARSILAKQLSSLTRMEKDKIINELNELIKTETDYKEILSSSNRVDSIIIEQLNELKKAYGDVRKTIIIEEKEYKKQQEEILVSDEPMFVGLTNKNTIKYMPYKSFNQMLSNKTLKQKTHIFIQGLRCEITNSLIIFLDNGDYIKCSFADLACYESFIENKKIIGIIRNVEENEQKEVIAVSKNGFIKKVKLSNLKSKNLKMTSFMKIEETDNLIGIRLVDANDDNSITLSTKNGIIHRFYQRGFSTVSQTAKPLGCINKEEDDIVVDFDINDSTKDNEYKILLFSKHENGETSLKILAMNDFMIKNRMAKGVKAISYFKKDLGQVRNMMIVSGDFLLTKSNGELLLYEYNTLITSDKGKKPDHININPMVTKFFIE